MVIFSIFHASKHNFSVKNMRLTLDQKSGQVENIFEVPSADSFGDSFSWKRDDCRLSLKFKLSSGNSSYWSKIVDKLRASYCNIFFFKLKVFFHFVASFSDFLENYLKFCKIAMTKSNINTVLKVKEWIFHFKVVWD